MKLTKEDMHNLYDLFYIIQESKEVVELLELNKMDKWADDIFERLDDEVIKQSKE